MALASLASSSTVATRARSRSSCQRHAGLEAEISSGWAEVRAGYGQCISFQQVQACAPPRWPAQEIPQQMHLDVIVDDLDAAEAAVTGLGATRHEHQPSTSFRVFLDPAGHPFCSLRGLTRAAGPQPDNIPVRDGHAGVLGTDGAHGFGRVRRPGREWAALA